MDIDLTAFVVPQSYEIFKFMTFHSICIYSSVICATSPGMYVSTKDVVMVLLIVLMTFFHLAISMIVGGVPVPQMRLRMA